VVGKVFGDVLGEHRRGLGFHEGGHESRKIHHRVSVRPTVGLNQRGRGAGIEALGGKCVVGNFAIELLLNRLVIETHLIDITVL
jgi:hypothetical protein